ncbi:hypothetical protein WJX81_003623 [Elliptochloris bilobata]|uniref:DUF2415 domain-containing protein n=1 Tax=Elliptochloris bilobata TaxID=381761 RepID=A0AAW1R1W4_9CHLO
MTRSPFEQKFVSIKEIYARPTKIQHWQLRDLVHCDDDYFIYCVSDRCTVRYDTRSDKSTEIQKLSFTPTSLAVGSGFIAAGGQCSQLDVRHVENGSLVQSGGLGASVNNALHIGSPAPSQLRLYVANNDQSVRVFALATMRPLARISTPTPSNYCALAPGGGLLACVGDAPDRGAPAVYLYRPMPAGYVAFGALRGYSDAGMSCAWSPSGACLAAASQDGRCTIWDTRTRQAVAQVRAGGACRCVKWAGGGADLLACSEHESNVHIIDSRTWASQKITLAPGGEEPHISGLAFAPSGRRLFVGLSGAGLALLDVDTLARTTFAAGDVN